MEVALRAELHPSLEPTVEVPTPLSQRVDVVRSEGRGAEAVVSNGWLPESIERVVARLALLRPTMVGFAPSRRRSYPTCFREQHNDTVTPIGVCGKWRFGNPLDSFAPLRRVWTPWPRTNHFACQHHSPWRHVHGPHYCIFCVFCILSTKHGFEKCSLGSFIGKPLPEEHSRGPEKHAELVRPVLEFFGRRQNGWFQQGSISPREHLLRDRTYSSS